MTSDVPALAALRRSPVAARRLLVFTCFLVTAVTLTPIVMMVLVAFQSDAESMAARPSFWPGSWHPENIGRAFDLVPLGRYLLNTVFFAGGTALLETVTAALAAYAFARLRFRGRSVLFGVYLTTLMIPSQVTLIPQFILVAKLHGVDTWPGMILPHAFTALGVFLLRQFFLGVPRDYEEAARLDGANRWQTFIRVIVPLAVPAIATLAVFKFISQWNNLLWPLVISNSDSTRTAAVGLQVFQSTNGTQWNLLLMAAAITTVPLIVLFFLTQRWFVKGITMSGLGGR
ncbi:MULTISPECIES: carbohydrate ABC transporter permease [Streptomyces]|uniref:Carbohydrate ABC transporter permease n=3 Tax=Streptomyces violaceusniger group TaxID=2839105 RepID=A0A6G4A874_9ACTN|nr:MULTISPECIES: carbohydrate ABC transporter permease [Streptomyces]MBI0378144.1 carbohydrate ABC transporter permease [Streptomyces albiflaviniger]GDY50589.1 sugar ABC transporter permease [Streptomyces violaceusniger]MBA6440235.1 carbohydrate ABC transporter permease [Streptomyces sp. GMR22]MBP2064122.1 multiple sugar transport system permease protein [Streptomyces iranensis]NEW69398.1 carbohydrate ABC transporter permease [Streptomyces rhizosphaericus]